MTGQPRQEQELRELGQLQSERDEALIAVEDAEARADAAEQRAAELEEKLSQINAAADLALRLLGGLGGGTA